MVATQIIEACPGTSSTPSADATPPPEPTGQPPAAPTADGEEPTPTAALNAISDDECNRGAGQSGELRMHSNGGGVHIQRGSVVSFDGTSLVVNTPDGPVTVVMSDDTHINGDVSAAFEVKVRGDLDEGVIEADEVKGLCPHGDEDEKDDDDEEDGDDDDDRGKKKHEDDDSDGDDDEEGDD
jgi:hypothetical protein